MPFDNKAFTAPPQAIALREKRYVALAGAFAAGQSAEDIAFTERLRGMDP